MKEEGRKCARRLYVTKIRGRTCCLEAFAVDDGGSRLIILLLGDPHLLEGGKRGQDRTTNPNGVFTFGRSDNLDLHGGWSERGNLLLHAVGDTRVHGCASGHNDISVQILSYVNVALHDRVIGSGIDAAALKTKNRWLEQSFRGTESLIADGDDLTVGQLI